MNIRRRSVVLALVVALAVTPALAGCSINGIVKTATGGNVDIGGTELPSSFPDDVPLYNDDITFAAGFGNETDGRGWNVSLRVNSVDDIDAIQTQLQNSGFGAVDGSDIIQQTSNDGRTIIVENDDYGVLVTVVKSNDDVIANYTVTDKSSGN